MRGRGIERRAVHAGDAAARFLDDQRAGRDVPRLQVLLPEAVEAAGGDVTEVERRRAEAPHRARAAEERAEQLHEIAASACARRTGKPVTSSASISADVSETRQRAAVQERALAALGREQLLPRRVVDGADLARPSISRPSDAQKIGRPCA